MSNIILKNVYKVYNGDVRAVSNFNLEIKDKEFIVFVGPSGCGKSTTLRMIAGLEEITSGDLYMNGERVNDVEPKDRNIAMVFQSYALYPHMTVFQNMAFGLKLRKVSKDEIKRRVQVAANILDISDYLDRKPKNLSGGQRQRVALGRAIVREPNVFLLDEPLSNLDAKLRVAMRVEITKLQKRLSTTFIYVTHDQTEAMTMGDRIVVMKDGLVQQVDTPANLYEQPCNIFVATFLGSPQMNLFDAKLIQEKQCLKIEFGKKQECSFSALKSKQLISSHYINSNVVFGIRPENIKISSKGVEAVIDAIEHLGSESIVYCNIEGIEGHFICKVPTNYDLKPKQKIFLEFDMERAHLFDKESTESILGTPMFNVLDVKCDGKDILIGSTKLSSNDSTSLLSHVLISSRNDISKIHVDVNDVLEAKTPDCIKLKAKIDFKVVGTDQVSYYSRIDGVSDYFVFRSKNEIKEGSEVELYIPIAKLTCLNSKNLKVNSKEEIFENSCNCEVSVKNNKTIIHLGNQVLTYDNLKVKPGKYLFTLNDENIEVEHTKKLCKLKKIPYVKHINTLSVKAYDEDKLDLNRNLLYVANKHFNEYLSFTVKNDFSVYSMDSFNIVIKPSDFKLTKLDNIK